MQSKFKSNRIVQVKNKRQENIGFPNGPRIRYGNFFTSKNQPKGRKSLLSRAVGPQEARLFFTRVNFKVKFPYLKRMAHLENVFL